MFLFTSSLISLGLPLTAQKVWNNVDGDWHTPENWTGGVPTALTGNANLADFSGPFTNNTVAITADATARAVRVGSGANIIFNLSPNTKLNTGTAWRIGHDLGSGLAASSLTINGSSTGTSEINLTHTEGSQQIFMNDGSSLILNGENLTVNTNGALLIGTRSTHNNRVEINNGATLNTGGIHLGYTASGGANSHGNQVIVQTGSKLLLHTGMVSVGNNSGHHTNNLVVTGNDSLVQINGQEMRIGNNLGTNLGGNFVEIRSGGKLETDSQISIRGYTTDSTDHGANRLTIGQGGTLSTDSSIVVGYTDPTTYTQSVLQLANGGILEGMALVDVHNGARFEAAGNGLANSTQVNIHTGGTLSVGLAEDSTAQILQIASTINFHPDSVLEFSLFANGVSDQIEILSGGNISGNVQLALDGIAAESGTTWTLFTGDTSLISATFDLSQLDSTSWDVSKFNQDGGWELTSIPEPATYAIIFGAGLAFIAGLRRRLFARQ